MKTLQDLELPIDTKIFSLLIEATPELWKSAVLVVEQRADLDPIDQAGFVHSISSPEHHREFVFPTDELLAATYELEQLYRAHGKIWTRAVFRVDQDAGGAWKGRVDFSY